ncbi:MAG TPA: efflux RND transporter periplasmic adaptor subunit [Candidatus Polarisedimenticolaceae bacterium]|nr:efflux RND transporter periplasmic adaptor subunit [Candidatus Polarisedimenticolaceae bacterium]
MRPEIVAGGKVRPQVGAEIRVGPRISGILTRLYVKVGDSVRKGELLAELDRTELEVAVEEARAALDEARAELSLAIASARRLRQLSGEHLTSQAALEEAEVQEVVAQAAVRRSESQLRRAEVELSYATITAPIAGTVTSVGTRQGETVAASFAVPSLVTIMDLSRLNVEAFIDEVDIGRILVGQSATIATDAFPGKSFKGHVIAVTPQTELRQSVLHYVVLIGLDEDYLSSLRPEMSVVASIVVGENRQVLSLPTSAIQRDEDGRTFVSILSEQGISRRDVSVGEIRGTQVEIKAGLSAGEVVALPRGGVEQR